jgi:pyruvate/2-oxoglutarate dehydrogenase complex dihydrolipoamide acyltransferase (E2) component
MPPTNDNTVPEPTLEESLQYLLRYVPSPVRDFILTNLGPKTQELMNRYQLHVDQGTVLERELLLMLLGQEQPADFVLALQNSNIPPSTVQLITTDINTEVFMKLREIEEKGNYDKAPAPQGVEIPTFIPTPVQAPPTPQPAPAPQPAYTPSPAMQIAPVGEHDVRTMASDIALVKSGGFHEQPATIPARAPAPIYSAPAPTPPSARPAMPPMQPSSRSPSMPQSENRDALHQILKQYGVDPYREPAE